MTRKYIDYKPKVMYVLQTTELGLSVTDIQNATGLKDRPRIKKVCDELYAIGDVGRSPIRGNGFKYKFIRNSSESSGQDSSPFPSMAIDLDAPSIVALVSKWGNEKWAPRIFKSFRNLPLTLAFLFKRAADVGNGANLEQPELLEYRKSLEDFKSDLEQTLKVVNGVLKIDELWDRQELAPYLLAVAPPDKLRETAHAVERLN